MASEADDAEMLAEIERDVDGLRTTFEHERTALLFSGEYDSGGAIISISAGAGGTEATDWAEMLLRMYLRWAERHRFRTEIVDATEGEQTGLKSVTVEIDGRRAYGWLRAERGVHRLVRISPYDAQKRRQTTFALVEVLPEVDDDVAEIELDWDEIRVDTYRSQGAGGQHVNKTDSAVRLTHFPTGHRRPEPERAVRRPRTRRRRSGSSRPGSSSGPSRRRRRELRRLKGEHVEAGWGNQIRSYVLHPYQMVKDHRTGPGDLEHGGRPRRRARRLHAGRARAGGDRGAARGRRRAGVTASAAWHADRRRDPRPAGRRRRARRLRRRLARRPRRLRASGWAGRRRSPRPSPSSALLGHLRTTDPGALPRGRAGRGRGRRAAWSPSSRRSGAAHVVPLDAVRPPRRPRRRAWAGRCSTRSCPRPATTSPGRPAPTPRSRSSNALYARHGIVPRVPVLELVGRPDGGPAPARCPRGVRAVPFELLSRPGRPTARGRAAWPPALGERRPGPPRLRPPRGPRLPRRRPAASATSTRRATGGSLGYGYTSPAGRLGPVAVQDEALFPGVLGHLLGAVAAGRGLLDVGARAAAGRRSRRSSRPACGSRTFRPSCAGTGRSRTSRGTSRSRSPSCEAAPPGRGRRRSPRRQHPGRGGSLAAIVTSATLPPPPPPPPPARDAAPASGTAAAGPRPARRRQDLPQRPGRPPRRRPHPRRGRVRLPGRPVGRRQVDAPPAPHPRRAADRRRGRSSTAGPRPRARAGGCPALRRRIGIVFQDFKLLPDRDRRRERRLRPRGDGDPAPADRAGRRARPRRGRPRRPGRPAPDDALRRRAAADAIARALVHEPRLIIADEPTGNLDPLISWEIIQLLLRINELGVTVLMATHNAEVVTSLRRRVVALEEGRIVRDEVGGYHRED